MHTPRRVDPYLSKPLRLRGEAFPSKAGSTLALIAFGVVSALVALELALQLGALALQLTGQPLPTTWPGGQRRVLCVGDSNTYGLYLADRTEAYPSQLERLWNAAASSPIEVLNLGYPGTNSSRLRRDLPRMLETLRPDVVIVMVGSNDFWTAPVALDRANVPGGFMQFVERHSRLYQLAHMLDRALDRRRLEVVYPVRDRGGSAGVARYGEVEFSMGWTEEPRHADDDGRLRALAENLRALAEIVRAFGAEPVFMTYPSRMWNYGAAGSIIRTAAHGSRVRLIDLAAEFVPVCPTEPCADWLYADHHPTAGGYRLIAEALVRALQGQL